MKLIFYINQIYEGGAERVITRLASSFADEGHESILVTSFKHTGEYRYSDKIVRLSLEENQLTQSRIKRNLSRITKLRQIIKSQRPDVVLSFMQEPNFRMLMATLGLRCKKVVSVRNDPTREYSGMLGIFVGKVLMPLLADGCVFQTKQARDWFPKRLKRKSKVIYNAVDPSFFKTRVSGVNEYWVAIGRLVEQKNYPVMISAFASIVKKYPYEKLRIYGEGPMHGELQELIDSLGMTDCISLCGQSNEIPSVLTDAKGFLMTSDYEGLPNALMEAMAIGLPCIATDCPCGGPAELINNNKNGILVSVSSEREIFSAICSLIEDRDFSESIGNNARIMMKENDPQSIFYRWQSFLFK